MNVKLYRPLSRRFNWEYSVFGEGKAWLIYDNKYNQEYYVIGNPDALKFMINRLAQSKLGHPHYEKIMNEKVKKKKV